MKIQIDDSRWENDAVAARWLELKNDSFRYQLLRRYNGKSVYRFDMSSDEVPTIIIKTWDLNRGSRWTNLKRKYIGELSGCENEIRTLRHVQSVCPALHVPRGFGMFPRILVSGQLVEVGLISDLGDCETLSEYLKASHASENATETKRVADFVVCSLKCLLLDAQIIDDDHSVINMLHSLATGRFHRIDFEIARRLNSVIFEERAIGSMLGRLLATCAFACQPDTRWVSELAARIGDELPRITPRSWKYAVDEMNRRLSTQLLTRGIDTTVDLDWFTLPK